MGLQIEATKNQQAHMGNTFKNDPPYGLPSILPFCDFTLLLVFFSYKHLTLGIPWIIHYQQSQFNPRTNGHFLM